MKRIMSIYDYSVMMHMKFHEDEKLLPFDWLNINEFGAIHKNFHQNVFRYTGVIALKLP